MIGILGGTFDPIHFGHLRLALELADGLELERVLLVPAKAPPHREQPAAAPALREAMVAAAVAGEPRLRLDGREMRRDGPSYAVETLEELRRELPGTPLCFLMGMDAFAGLDRWHRWERILELAHLGLAARPGAGPPAGTAAGILRERQVDKPSQLNATLAGRIIPLQVPMLDISSSRVRCLIGSGRSARYLLPDPVLEIIRNHRLYGHGS